MDDPLPLITAAHDFRMDPVVGARAAMASWSMPVIAETVDPVPRETVTRSVTLTVIEATGLSTIGVPFGGPPQWVAAASGFHAAQWVDGRPLRWTDGHGRLSIPVYGSSPSRLAVSIADAGPQGTDLRIVLNGQTLFDGRLGAGPWAGEYELEAVVDLGQGDTAQVEIISSVFERGVVEGDDTPAKFGVQLEHVVLLGNEP